MSYSPSDNADPCQETAGFLFSHPCPRPALHQCTACAKPICSEHGHEAGGGLMCTTCYRDRDTEEENENLGDTDDGDSEEGQDEDGFNPMLSSSYYYQGYGHYGPGSWGHRLPDDPHDFTEADGRVLDKNESVENLDFEEDMQGS